MPDDLMLPMRRNCHGLRLTELRFLVLLLVDTTNLSQTIADADYAIHTGKLTGG